MAPILEEDASATFFSELDAEPVRCRVHSVDFLPLPCSCKVICVVYGVINWYL